MAKSDLFFNDLIALTVDGGIAYKLTNNTGANSVKGSLVVASSGVNDGVDLCPSNDPDPIGVMYSDGVANGGKVWVVQHGKAYVLLENNTTATRGYWIRTSANTAGRVDITNYNPPGGGIPEIDTHLKEVGHCLETVASGVDALALAAIHFN